MDWEREVAPVLRTVYDLLDDQVYPYQLDGRAVASALGREDEDPRLAGVLHQLVQAGYIDATYEGMLLPIDIDATERGLQATRGWPVPGQGDVEALLKLLDQRIASPGTSEE